MRSIRACIARWNSKVGRGHIDARGNVFAIEEHVRRIQAYGKFSPCMARALHRVTALRGAQRVVMEGIIQRLTRNRYRAPLSAYMRKA